MTDTATRATESKPGTQERGSPGVVVLLVALLVLLPVFYVLSVGPAQWLSNRGYLSQGVESLLGLAYTPLQLLFNNWEPFRNLMIWYLAFWN